MKKLSLCLWFLLPLALLGQGANEDVFQVEVFSTREGLIQSQVRAIMQDSRGYLWFGTHRGLSRFDGQLFYNYEPDPTDSLALTGNFISGITEDKMGRIWLATDLGVSCFDGVRFHNFVTEDSLDKVLSILEESPGKLWFGTEYRGLTLFSYPLEGELRKGQFKHRPFSWRDEEKVKRTVQTLFKGHDGRIWLGRDKGLFEQGKNGEIYQRYRDTLPDPLMVYDLMEDREGRLWLATNQGVYCRESDGFKHFGRAEGLPDLSVFCLTQDHEGTLWLGTAQGIARLVGNTILPFQTASTTENRLLGYSVRSCLTDHEGNLWFGTEGGGILKITRGVFVTYDENRGLSSNLVKSFLEDDQGQIWISTIGKGLNIFRNGEIVRKYSEAQGLAGSDVGFSFKDSQGNLWFTSYSQGLSRFRNGRFDNFQVEDGLASNQTFCLEEDSEGRIWVGTKLGISVLNSDKFQRHYTVQKGPGQEEYGPLDNTIYYIKRALNGKLWIGTPSGLSIYHPQDDTFAHYPEVGKNIISIQEDSQGRMWLSSSSGLIVSDGTDFSRLRPAGNAAGNNVVAMVFSQGEKYLWLGTEAGVYRLDLEYYDDSGQAAFDHFTYTDGLPSHETNANAAFRDSEGNIWFGTIEGAVRCPEEVLGRSAGTPPRINLTAVRANQGRSARQSQDSVDPLTWLPKALTIPYNSRISFEWTGISLTNPSGVRYQYQMEGLDEAWSGATRSTNVVYPNLDPGTYTFKVKSSSQPDAWEVPEARYTFVVRPAFWQAWWFILLMVLGLILLVFLIYQSVNRENKRRREEENMKNTAEKLALEHQALYAMMNPHFTFNALQSIQYFIHRQDRIAANKFLSRFAKLVRKNLDSTQRDFISLGEEIERLDLYLSLEQMRFKEKFEYEIYVDPHLDPSDTLLPPMILQPFVENSIKHGIMSLEKGGEIKVVVAPKGEEYIEILITDNGIGIEASKVKKANRPSEHVSKGMQITRDRLALFGKMTQKGHEVSVKELKDDSGKVLGTQVHMLLPLHV